MSDDVVIEGIPHVVLDDAVSERISGAIARAVGKSVSRRDRPGPLPNVRSQLRADRARALAQRDRARAEVQRLVGQLSAARADLAAAIELAEPAERDLGK